MGGEELIKLIRKGSPKTFCIAMSGYSKHPVILDYKSYGFNGKLIKPFKFKNLIQILYRNLNIPIK